MTPFEPDERYNIQDTSHQFSPRLSHPNNGHVQSLPTIHAPAEHADNRQYTSKTGRRKMAEMLKKRRQGHLMEIDEASVASSDSSTISGATYTAHGNEGSRTPMQGASRTPMQGAPSRSVRHQQSSSSANRATGSADIAREVSHLKS